MLDLELLFFVLQIDKVHSLCSKKSKRYDERSKVTGRTQGFV